MSSSLPETDASATDVGFNDDELSVALADGRRIFVPLAWFPKLLEASSTERANWEPLGDGQGIHWPDIDEDLSVNGLLAGRSATGGSKRAG